MVAHGHGDGIGRVNGAHDRLVGQHCAVWHATGEFDQVGWVAAGQTATNGHVAEVQRAFVQTLAHDVLDGFQLMYMAEHEERLDAVLTEHAQVGFIEARARFQGHLAERRHHGRIGHRSAGHIPVGQQFGDVHLGGVDGDGHLIRLALEQCQGMP
ncbi:hypothetical protein FQZ97_858650 [compost metagenome]